MDNGSFALGRLGGIRLKAHWSAGLIALLVFASLGRVIGPGPALLGTVGFLASILLHELGHALGLPHAADGLMASPVPSCRLTPPEPP